MTKEERLAKLRAAANILGPMPSTGTQDTEYRAFKLLSDEIDRLDPKCNCGAPLSDPDALACQTQVECPIVEKREAAKRAAE